VPAQMVGTHLREWPRYPCTGLQGEHFPSQQPVVTSDDDSATVLPDSDRDSDPSASRADSDNESHDILVFVCPNCEAKFQTSEDFSSHWVENHAPPLVNSSPYRPSVTNASSAEDDADACQTPPFPDASHGPVQLVECCAFEAKGQLTPVWQEDPQTDDDNVRTVMPVSERGSDYSASPSDSEDHTHSTVSYVCPTCEAKFHTSEDFTSHWVDNHAPLVNSSPCGPSVTNVSSAEDDADACPTPPFPDASHGPVQPVECCAFDAKDQLTPVRQEDPQTDENVRTVMPVNKGGSDYSAYPADSEDHSHSTVCYVCPTCEAKFQTSEDFSSHWVDNHAPAPVSLSAHRSCESADASEDNAEARQTRPLPDASQAPVQPVQCIECDAEGQPTIVRQEDPQTGALRTIVFNEDGSKRVFGEKTVSSLADSDEAEVQVWIGHMTDRHLKGLVHEVTDRACKGSGDYHRRKDDLENRTQQRHYRYFGLSDDASQKDLDSVYRRLARSMHPDKNGGTEDAKEMFQTMKHKYEVLKAQIAKPLGSELIAQQQQQPKQPKQPEQADDREQQQYVQPQQQQEDNRDDAHEPEQTQAHQHQHEPQAHQHQHEPRISISTRPQNEDVDSGCIAGDTTIEAELYRREAYDEDDSHKQSSEPLVDVINANTNDRGELEKVAWQMLQQLRAIRIGMVTLDSEFQLLEREDDCNVEAR